MYRLRSSGDSCLFVKSSFLEIITWYAFWSCGTHISPPSVYCKLSLTLVESTWNLMAHGDAREGKWRENWRMEWVASTLHTASHCLGTWCIQHYYRWCAQLGCQQSTKLTPPANLNGLVPFAERPNLVSARVPSHFKRSLPLYVNFGSFLCH